MVMIERNGVVDRNQILFFCYDKNGNKEEYESTHTFFFADDLLLSQMLILHLLFYSH